MRNGRVQQSCRCAADEADRVDFWTPLAAAKCSLPSLCIRWSAWDSPGLTGPCLSWTRCICQLAGQWEALWTAVSERRGLKDTEALENSQGSLSGLACVWSVSLDLYS